MDQQALRAWEAKCIQEEPPFCQAACPLHVDVRAFAAHMAAGKVDLARGVLQRTMPLPGVLGRICDHPCQARCRRADVDEAIRIGDLERACVRLARPGPAPMPLPSRGKTAAILGGGFSSLAAAWDLARKGHGVTLFFDGPAPGGLLRTLPAEILPAEALEAELRVLERLGIRMEPLADAAVTSQAIEAARAAHGTVYVGLDGASSPDLDALRLGRPDPVTLATKVEGVFLGGKVTDPISWVGLAMDGRRAATTMDRLLQNVSLTASRDREGPFETRLYTSVEGIEPRIAQSMADAGGYSASEAAAEAGRCIQCQCLECVKVCAYLAHYKGYPKKYAREIYNNLSVVQGMRHANPMILSCSRCGLCAQVCPNGFHMGDLCAEARGEMVVTGRMPPSAHDFALRDLHFNTSAQAALLRHQPGAEVSAWCFMPGCQLAGSSPNHALRMYDHLREKLPGGVGVMLYCCGAPAQWAGRDDIAATVTAGIRSQWEQLGKPTMILGCTTCVERFGAQLPEIPVVSLWQAVAQTGLPTGATAAPGAMWLHDPCTARHAAQVRQAVRSLLTALGQRVEEPRLTAETTECCGYGGLMDYANPQMGSAVATLRASRRADHPEEKILAYCAMCRDSLSRQGATVVYLLDLLFPGCADNTQPTAHHPLIRKRLGLPDRHHNRAWLRHQLAQDSRASREQHTQPWSAIRIFAAAQVQQLLDSRRILLEDIQQVLLAAGEGPNRFRNPATGHYLTGRRLLNVSYWVEYSPATGQEDAYEVHRAWSHRMTVEVPH